MKRIGIDVGGTNTDAVLLDGMRVVGAVKTPTSQDVTSGIRNAIAALIEKLGAPAREASRVIVGTTHFVNAVIERKHLNKVASIRICLPASASIPQFADWPADLRQIVRGETYMLPGGYEVDGREIAPFDEARMRDVARRIADSDTRAVAVSGVFSPLRGDHEARAAEILQEICPDVRVTQSRHIGRVGLLERENVALLNAALCDLARHTVSAFKEAVASSGLNAKLLLTQNDGTVFPTEAAEAMPVMCFSSGPTNSMRGAAFLSKLDNATVVDVGGTSSDIGVLKNGFPRETNTVVKVGGVRTLFRMPDVLSLALGGGSIIRQDPFRIGPDSVGFRIQQESMVFGGSTLTATDLAVALGRSRLGDTARVGGLDPALPSRFREVSRQLLEDGIDAMKTRAGDVVVVAVGGGAFLIPDKLRGVSEVVFVEHHDVANAVGAGIAQISGEVDQIFSGMSREEAVQRAIDLALARAIDAGANAATLKPVEVEDLPLAYMPGDTRRVRVRVAGDIDET